MEANDNDGVIFRAEEELLGFNHADVGGALITAWKLADTLKDTITYHHAPLLARNYPVETAIVHIANCVVNSIGPESEINEHLLDDHPAFEPETLNITGINLKILPQLMDQAWEQTAEVLDIICPRVESM